MSAKTPSNPVTGPPQPPGFMGLRRWTDIRAAAPLLLIAAAIWMFNQPLAITQPSDARNAPDKGTMVVDTADLVARTPEPHETPTPKPHHAASVRPPAVAAPTIATNDLSPAGLEGQAAQPTITIPAIANQSVVAPAPAAPPTPSAADIAREKKASADQAALHAPLISTPSSAVPLPA